jgi:hypothetical protein
MKGKKFIEDVIKTSYLEEKEGSIMGDSDGEDFMAPPIEARETGLSAANLNGLNIKQQQSTLNDNRATD